MPGPSPSASTSPFPERGDSNEAGSAGRGASRSTGTRPRCGSAPGCPAASGLEREPLAASGAAPGRPCRGDRLRRPAPLSGPRLPGGAGGAGRACRLGSAGVVFGNGGDDMLLLAALAATGSGRRAVHPSPGFSMYPWAVRLAGGEPRPAPLGEGLRYDIPDFLRRIEAEQPSLVFITTPHNPTGESLPLDALREVAEAAPGFLLVDEAYHEFSSGNARPLLDEFGNVSCSALSRRRWRWRAPVSATCSARRRPSGTSGARSRRFRSGCTPAGRRWR